MHEKGFLERRAVGGGDARSRCTLAPAAEAASELAPEAVEMAKAVLYRLEPEEARVGGFTITTSIDPKLQAAARKALREALGGVRQAPRRSRTRSRLPADDADRKGKARRRRATRCAPFEGTPSFEQHRVLVGTVAGADDAAGTFDVRVGHGARRRCSSADYERYNPRATSRRARSRPVGRARAREPARAGRRRCRSGRGRAASRGCRSAWSRARRGRSSRSTCARGRSSRSSAATRGRPGALDRATQSRRQPGSTFKPIVYSYALHSRRFTPATLVDPNPDVFEGGYHPSNFEGWQGHDPLRLREALANSVNVAAVRVLRDVGPGERRRRGRRRSASSRR